MNLEFITENGETFKLKKINGDSLEIELPSNKIILNDYDLDDLEHSIHRIRQDFDKHFFKDLQRKITSYAKTEIEKLSDERLFSLARYNDRNRPKFKVFTLNLRR